MITVDTYLAQERQADERREFDAGETVAMAGGTRWHNLLTGRLFSALLRHLFRMVFSVSDAPTAPETAFQEISYRHNDAMSP